MKKIYTYNHKSKIEFEPNKRFSSTEHANLSIIELGNNILKDKCNLIKYSLDRNLRDKLLNLNFLIKRIEEKNYNKLFSLGSGYSDLEYFLNLAIQDNKEIISSDFDQFIVDKSNTFFPDFKTIKFDMFNDSLSTLNKEFDLVFSFGAFYVLNDKEFIRLLKDLKSSGVKEVIDFHAGFMNKTIYSKYLLKSIYFFIYKLFNQNKNKGKFHGYMRNRKDLLTLYKKSGWKPVREIWNYGGYQYTCILN